MIIMIKPYLIQRLKKPNKPKDNLLYKLVESFTFGGGCKNGGLSEDAMGLLRNIFSFDYMGSAEFEFGALPRALFKIATNTANTTFEMNCKTRNGNTSTIYVICNSTDVDEIKNWLHAKAYDEYDKTLRTKERVGLQGAIDHERKEIFGWIELDTGFFFFIDKEMFEKTKKLFFDEVT